MIIEGTRFGTIEVNDDRMITLPAGMIGFANETRFILLEPKEGRNTGWLQSIDNPELAFPVMNANALNPAYPPNTLKDTARNAGVRSCGVAWGFQPESFQTNPPGVLIHHPQELLNVLQ